MGRLKRILAGQEIGLVLVILVLGGLIAAFAGSVVYPDGDTGRFFRVNRFLQPANLDLLIKETSFFAIMAVGATFIIISGGIDLSVGSVYCLSAIYGATVLHHFGPSGSAGGWWVVPLAVVVCAGVGALCGLVNGLLIVMLRVHPFIITLGTMAILRGIAFIKTKGLSIGEFPKSFTDDFVRQRTADLFYPVPMSVMLLVTLGGLLVLAATPIGRRIYAIGGNEEAGRFSGVRVGRVKVFVYVAGGLTAGIAAMIMLGYYGSASSSAGMGYELEVIAAAVVGGASLSGGRGTAVGAMLGALVIRMIDNAVTTLEVDTNYRRIIIGCVVILAVVLDQLSRRLRERRR